MSILYVTKKHNLTAACARHCAESEWSCVAAVGPDDSRCLPVEVSVILAAYAAVYRYFLPGALVAQLVDVAPGSLFSRIWLYWSGTCESVQFKKQAL